jgi:crotonobetainyl-CoA:carnitine CoA-transferase CaiB-like acyl-CoA transferase
MGPLSGLRVIDVSIMAAGPWTGSLLGMLGAEVIKIEPPAGDGTRWVLPTQGGMGTNFICLNVNKQDIVLDLKKPEDHAVALELIRDADIFVQNFRGGVIQRLKLAWEDLKKVNPSLVYCSISGFGEDGPLARAGAADYVVQAFSGFAGLNGRTADDFEQFRFSGFIDLTTSSVAAQAILAALLERQRTGEGQKVEVAMLEAALEMQSTRLAELLLAGQEAVPTADRSAALAPDGAFATLDHPLFLTVHSDDEWRRFATAIERSDLVDDARFATNAARLRHARELDAELQPAFAAKSALWWLRLLQRHGIASGIAHEFETLRHHEQVTANGHIAEIDSPWGQVAVGGTPWRFSRTPVQVCAPSAPGADTAALVEPLRAQRARAGGARVG